MADLCPPMPDIGARGNAGDPWNPKGESPYLFPKCTQVKECKKPSQCVFHFQFAGGQWRPQCKCGPKFDPTKGKTAGQINGELAVVFPKDKPTVDLQGTKDKTCNVLAYTEEVKEKGKVKDVLVIAGCDNLTCTDTTKECQLGYRANAKDPTILELHCWCAQPPK